MAITRFFYSQSSAGNRCSVWWRAPLSSGTADSSQCNGDSRSNSGCRCPRLPVLLQYISRSAFWYQCPAQQPALSLGTAQLGTAWLSTAQLFPSLLQLARFSQLPGSFLGFCLAHTFCYQVLMGPIVAAQGRL